MACPAVYVPHAISATGIAITAPFRCLGVEDVAVGASLSVLDEVPVVVEIRVRELEVHGAVVELGVFRVLVEVDDLDCVPAAGRLGAVVGETACSADAADGTEPVSVEFDVPDPAVDGFDDPVLISERRFDDLGEQPVPDDPFRLQRPIREILDDWS